MGMLADSAPTCPEPVSQYTLCTPTPQGPNSLASDSAWMGMCTVPLMPATHGQHPCDTKGDAAWSGLHAPRLHTG